MCWGWKKNISQVLKIIYYLSITYRKVTTDNLIFANFLMEPTYTSAPTEPANEQHVS